MLQKTTFLILIVVLCFSVAVAPASKGAGQDFWFSLAEEKQHQTGVEDRLELAIAYANSGLLDMALGVFQELEKEPNLRESLQAIITNLEEQGQGGVLWINKMAFAHYSLLDFAAAATYFESACEAEPGNVWIRQFTAITYSKLNDLDKAMEHLKEAQNVDPSNEYTHLLLAMAYYQKKDYLRAAYHYLRSPNARRKLEQYL